MHSSCRAVLFVCAISFNYQSLAAESLLVQVNQEKISDTDFELFLTLRGVSVDSAVEERQVILDQLVDRKLIQQFLKQRRIDPVMPVLDRQWALVRRVLKSQDDPESKLAELGLSLQDVREHLEIISAWDRYVKQVTTERQITEYFDLHRAKYDGTRRVVSQIFLKKNEQHTAQQRLQDLRELRSQISSGQMTFAQAAKTKSESPSAAEGGKIGSFSYFSRMPMHITRQAFAQPVGEVGQPFESPFGYHMLLVEKELPGELSLEDARPQILKLFSQNLWDQTTERLRKTAKVRVITPLR